MIFARKCTSAVSRSGLHQRIRPSSTNGRTITIIATATSSSSNSPSTSTMLSQATQEMSNNNNGNSNSNSNSNSSRTRSSSTVTMKKKTIQALNTPVVNIESNTDLSKAGSISDSGISTSTSNASSSSSSSSSSIASIISNSLQRDFSSVASSTATSFDSPTGGTPTASNNANKSTYNPLEEMEEIIKNSNSKFSLDELKELALQPCTPLSLGDMYKYASANVTSKNYAPQRLRNAQFLYREIPIRIAQRTVDLLTLPHGLNKTQSVQDIAHIYLKYLHSFKMMSCPNNDEEELSFTRMLRKMVLDRSSIPEAIGRGVFALKDHRTEGLDLQRLQTMEKALYRFFNARTGLRLLTEHHVLSCRSFIEENKELRKDQSLFEQVVVTHESENNNDNSNESEGEGENENESEGVIVDELFGCIQKNCDPTTEAKKVAKQIMDQCRKRYGISPEIEVIDCTPAHFVNSDFTYVPHHLQYTLAELLKNSCRATVRRYMEGTITKEDHVHHGSDTVQQGSSLPSIRVVVAKGAEDVTIKIADKAGGVPRSVIDKMWTFAHSTLQLSDANAKTKDTHFEIDEFTGTNVKGKGFNIRGFGLPLARIYARYFGGELTLKSMEGYGVDAYLYLPVLGIACENLPKRVLKSPGQGDSVHDGNHHVYQGDSFSMSAGEPWGNTHQARHFTSEAFNEKLSKVAL